MAEEHAAKTGSHSFECTDNSGDLMEISFAQGDTKAGTVTFSNTSGTCKYTNNDGEELTFSTATGRFTVLEEGRLEVVWKPLGKKPAKDTVKIVYGVDGAKGTYEPRVEQQHEE